MNEWVEWNGGECPISNDAVIKVQFRCDTRAYAERSVAERAFSPQGNGFRWEHGTGDSSYDIVAYKVVK